MGRNAGLSSEGRLLGVYKIGDTWVPEGTISARTMNPSNTESGGGVGLIGNYWSKPETFLKMLLTMVLTKREH